MKLKTLFTILLLGGLFLFFQEDKIGNASEFPSRSVEVIVASSPGGATDMAMRPMGEELSKALGFPVIFTNMPGANGVLAAEHVARAKPDGYTILATSGSLFTVTPILSPSVHYKFSDFIPLCKYVKGPNVFIVKKTSPYNKFEDVISYAKNNPGKLTCASPGIGTNSHFSLEMIKAEAGIDVVHMPCKSAPETITALLGGQVDFATTAFGGTIGLLKSGDIRCLAGISDHKLPGFPNIPTLRELGYTKATLIFWAGVFLPKGTPKPAVDKLALIFEKTTKNPAVINTLGNVGYILDYEDGPTLAKLIPEEYKIAEEILRKAKILK